MESVPDYNIRSADVIPLVHGGARVAIENQIELAAVVNNAVVYLLGDPHTIMSRRGGTGGDRRLGDRRRARGDGIAGCGRGAGDSGLIYKCLPSTNLPIDALPRALA